MTETLTLTLPRSAVNRLATLRISDLRLNDPLGSDSPILQDWQAICAEAASAIEAEDVNDILRLKPPFWFTAPIDEPEETDEERAERAKDELKALAQSFFDDVLRPAFKAIAEGRADLRSRLG